MIHFLRLKLARLLLCLGILGVLSTPVLAETVLAKYLPTVQAADLVAGADAFGPIRSDLAVAPVLKGGRQIGWVFLTSDFVGTTGYSGKPIHTLVAVDDQAKITGVKLVKHSEPIVLIGIPDAEVKALAASYLGMDLAAMAQSGGKHDLNIISGATVTVMVLDDSILRSGIKVARALGLGGLGAEVVVAPTIELDPAASAPADWAGMEGDGTLRRLSLDVAQVNAAFAALNDPRATAKPETAPPDAVYIEMQAALVSVPAVGQALLSPQDQTNLTAWLQKGDQALMIVGKGIFSFKGSGYVRGGIFDRIVLVQDDVSVRFHDHDHKRLGSIAAKGAPDFSETDLFRIPAASGFDVTKPFRIQLLVQRQVAAIEKDFITFDLPYTLPPHYLRTLAAQNAAPAIAQDESAAQTALWQKIWVDNQAKIAGLAAMLAVLTLVFFFQSLATRNARVFFWFRIGFLTVTLVFWAGVPMRNCRSSI